MSELLIWRLVRQLHAKDAFSGEGARLWGGRWNPPGTRVVYCAESRALAALETLVNVRDPKLLVGQAWTLIPAVVPTDCIERPLRVPENWQANPPPPDPQQFGARWLESARRAALRVPSVVVHGEFNYLLNPAHPEFGRVRVGRPEAFSFDPRLGR